VTDQEIVVVALAVLGTGSVLLWPLIRALATRVCHHRRGAMKTRLAEVEERLDFAERLLTWSETNDQLPGGVPQ
jgi:hypothetical protein